MKEGSMKKDKFKSLKDDLRPSYDLRKIRGTVRGKYASRFKKGSNIIRLEPDVARVFDTDKAVNGTLRSLIKLAQTKITRAA
jgi:hypothetical protein